MSNYWDIMGDVLMLQTIMHMLSRECGSYGGIDMCIKCKKIGADKYVNESGLEANFCDICPNNMQAVKWDD